MNQQWRAGPKSWTPLHIYYRRPVDRARARAQCSAHMRMHVHSIEYSIDRAPILNTVYILYSVPARGIKLGMAGRGALIVFEGCDRVGKSTQCRRLVEALNSSGMQARKMSFPDRTTEIGKQIDAYLSQQVELEDHSVHLLFAANRWEMVPEMKRLLMSGVSLVVDRYAFSGVAFTAAKQIPLSWCRGPDVGLPAPDQVFYLDLPARVAQEREEYGSERYEKAEFQELVKQQFSVMMEQSWKVVNAARTIEEIHEEVLETTKKVIAQQAKEPITLLWTK